MPNFQRILAVTNTRSSATNSTAEYMQAIEKAAPTAGILAIPIDDVRGRLATLLQPNSLICVAGGDGSVNSVARTLLGNRQLSASQKSTPLLPLWCGNANDLAYAVNGRPSVAKCKTIIQQGRIVPIYPLRCTIEHNGQVSTQIAVSYMSFGAVAHAAQRYNQPDFRKNPMHNLPGIRPFNEVIILLQALYDTPAFTIEQNGEVRQMYDWIIGKSPRMAKNVRLPIALTDRAFYQSIVQRKNLPDIVSRAAGMMWDLIQPKHSKKPITFTVRETTWAQFDGEPIRLPAHATVTITLHPRPLRVLSTVLAT